MPKIRGLRPDIKYDHKSVMHYPATHKNENGDVKVEFTAKNGEQFSLTDQVQPSDFQHINTMYRCDQEYVHRAQRYQSSRTWHLMGFNGSIDAIEGFPAEEEVESE
uniref:Peptidase M12A domain-containing protein n=1 Tax=Ditylenchus dipsaci TaxID=166011 RepID=A0A915DVJ4_9BILA